MLCGGRPSSQPLAEGDYHGPLSIEVEDPLMPNNLVAIQKSAVISE